MAGVCKAGKLCLSSRWLRHDLAWACVEARAKKLDHQGPVLVLPKAFMAVASLDPRGTAAIV